MKVKLVRVLPLRTSLRNHPMLSLVTSFYRVSFVRVEPGVCEPPIFGICYEIPSGTEPFDVPLDSNQPRLERTSN